MTADPLAARAIAALVARGESVATAESLTGGLLCAALTSVPGASEVVRGGVVAYATDLKADLLGVEEGLLARNGPVDPDVAAQMASGVARACRADYGIATTGVAGPAAADGVPVGTVFVAAYGRHRRTWRRLDLAGDRESVRRDSVAAALELLLALLDPRDCVG